MINNLPYDTLKDFSPITLLATAPLLLVTHPSLPFNTAQELIEYARKQPGKLAYGSSGNGGPQHLAGEIFKSMAKVDIIHVPYKGSAPAAIDLLGGHVQIGFGDLLTVLPYVKGGRLKPLAFTGTQRSSISPEIPTITAQLSPTRPLTGALSPTGPSATSQKVLERSPTGQSSAQCSAFNPESCAVHCGH